MTTELVWATCNWCAHAFHINPVAAEAILEHHSWTHPGKHVFFIFEDET